jgi:hypothetical protein
MLQLRRGAINSSTADVPPLTVAVTPEFGAAELYFSTDYSTRPLYDPLSDAPASYLVRGKGASGSSSVTVSTFVTEPALFTIYRGLCHITVETVHLSLSYHHIGDEQPSALAHLFVSIQLV